MRGFSAGSNTLRSYHPVPSLQIIKLTQVILNFHKFGQTNCYDTSLYCGQNWGNIRLKQIWSVFLLVILNITE